jgi:hypothetical protein
MYGPDESWEDAGEHTKSDIVNDPLKEKTPTKVHWHSILGLSDTFFVGARSDIYDSVDQLQSFSSHQFRDIIVILQRRHCINRPSAPTGSLIDAEGIWWFNGRNGQCGALVAISKPICPIPQYTR